jgi:acyl carrier protein
LIDTLDNPEQPHTNTESALIVIWRSALRLEMIDVDTPFLNLGGDSLSAMLCISRISSEFGQVVALECFFDGCSTLRQIASSIDELASSDEIISAEE